MPGSIDYRALFYRSPNPYVLLAPDLTIVAANDAYLRITASRRDDLIGRNLFDVFPNEPDDPNNKGALQLRESLERVLHTGEPDTLAIIPYTVPRHTPTGIVVEERYWSATHTPILNDRGDVKYILQHTVDVTELHHLKQELRTAEAALDTGISREQLEGGVLHRAQAVQEANVILESQRKHLLKLFEEAPGFIAVLRGPEHVVQIANNTYRQLVGQRDVVGMRVADAFPEVVGQGFFELLDQVYQTGEPYVGRRERIRLRRRPDAPPEEVYVDFIYQPIFEADGTISGIFVEGHEVTDLVRAQEELQELNQKLEQRVEARTAELEARNRELQEFAYVASHDLQEPLRKVSSFADLVLAEFGDVLGEEGRHYLLRMQNAARRMATLIQDLLAYSRVSTRARGFERVNLNQIANEVLNDLQILIEETQGRVELDSLPEIDADPLQMRQLFQNLIANALKFHRPDVPPVVEVYGHTETDEEGGPICVLEFKDNGIGFPQQYVDRIFAPFQRLHSREEYQGTGIGLAICRRIAERHNGTITARSTPGEGSVFIVRLPLYQHEEVGISDQSHAQNYDAGDPAL